MKKIRLSLDSKKSQSKKKSPKKLRAKKTLNINKALTVSINKSPLSRTSTLVSKTPSVQRRV